MDHVEDCIGEGEGSNGARQVCLESLQRNWNRAQRVLERAKEICYASRLARGRALVQREKCRWVRSPEADLPPLEYVVEADWVSWKYALPPLDVVLDWSAASPPKNISRLYVWGYGLSPDSLLQQEFQETVAARRFASERGWDAGRPHAWAGERSFPLELHAALREMEPVIRADPFVAGWGGRVLRGR